MCITSILTTYFTLGAALRFRTYHLEISQRQFIQPFDSLSRRRCFITFSTSSNDDPWKRREEWIRKPRPSENPGQISPHTPDHYIDQRDTEKKDIGSTQPTPVPPPTPDKK